MASQTISTSQKEINPSELSPARVSRGQRVALRAKSGRVFAVAMAPGELQKMEREMDSLRRSNAKLAGELKRARGLKSALATARRRLATTPADQYLSTAELERALAGATPRRSRKQK